MAKPDVQDIEIAPSSGAQIAERPERVYLMSRQGRRQAFILLLGVASIWIFALWTLVTILQDGITGVEWVSLLLMLGILLVAPLVAWTLLEEANCRIVTNDEGIEYRTMAGIKVAYSWDELTGFKPKSGKSRLARFFLGEDDTDERNNKVVIAEASEPRLGEHPARGNGGNVSASGDTMAEAQSGADLREPDHNGVSEEDEDEPETLLVQTKTDGSSRIASPVLRFLHRQAHGAALPIYGGLVNRSELISEINLRYTTYPTKPQDE